MNTASVSDSKKRKHKSRRWLYLISAGLLFLLTGWYLYQYLYRNLKSADQLIIEVTFMQYACGDDNDDVQVTKVNLAKYRSLVGKDLDPMVAHSPKLSNLKEYFYDHAAKNGMHFRMTGRLSRFQVFGCDNSAPAFWIETIECLDGSGRLTKAEYENIYLKIH